MQKTQQLQKKKSGDNEWRILVEQGKKLEVHEKDIRWAKGDLLNQVKSIYGEESVKRFADECGWAESETQVYYYLKTSRNFDENSRRRENLSYSHFRELAEAFPENKEKQDEWVGRIEEQKLSVRELRWQLQAQKPLLKPSQFEIIINKLDYVHRALEDLSAINFGNLNEFEKAKVDAKLRECAQLWLKITGGGDGIKLQ